MRHFPLRLSAPLAVAALALIAGCVPFPLATDAPVKPARVQRVEEAAEPTSTLSVNTASGTVALGAELQRSAGVLHGRMWAMSTSGKADLAGVPPLAVLGVDKAGKRAVLWQAEPFPKGSGTVIDSRGTFAVKLPPATKTVVLTSGLKAVGSSDAPPEAEVPLADVPVVAAPSEW
jgi:hypothetical protein